MSKITRDLLLGKTKDEVDQIVAARKEKKGKLSDSEQKAVTKYLADLRAGKILTDDKMLQEIGAKTR